MRRSICLVLVLSAHMCGAQDVWVQFEKNDLYGYKDLKGHVKIPAMFDGIPPAGTFYNIIAVSKDGKRYYLLKNGRQVAKDSVYISDVEYDYEREGKIRFRDPKTQHVGFLDKNGKVVIPAVYNAVTRFHNGMARAIKDATRQCLGNDCEHWTWLGGSDELIDEHGKVLISDWRDDSDDIDWYSMRKNAPPANSAYITIQGTDNVRYSFLCYNREFKQWFYSVFLAAVKSGSSAQIAKLLFPRVVFSPPGTAERKNMDKTTFLKTYGRTIRTKLVSSNTQNTFISHEDLNPYIFTGKMFDRYTDPERYPDFEAVISRYSEKGKLAGQDDFEFIRTENGYRLICVSVVSSF